MWVWLGACGGNAPSPAPKAVPVAVDEPAVPATGARDGQEPAAPERATGSPAPTPAMGVRDVQIEVGPGAQDELMEVVVAGVIGEVPHVAASQELVLEVDCEVAASVREKTGEAGVVFGSVVALPAAEFSLAQQLRQRALRHCEVTYLVREVCPLSVARKNRCQKEEDGARRLPRSCLLADDTGTFAPAPPPSCAPWWQR